MDFGTEQITIEELDTQIKKLVEEREAYEAAKKISDDLHHNFEQQKDIVINMLTLCGKTSYKVDGVVGISTSIKNVFKTPKTPEEKQLFFNYLTNTHGTEGFLTYATVNHNSLNSLMKIELETGFNDFKAIGLEAPTPEVTLSMRSVK